MTLRAWLEPLQRGDVWLLILANALPLLGVIGLGWDAGTMVIIYWIETAIVGLWTCARIALAPATALSQGADVFGGAKAGIGRSGLVVFITFHAGIFMAVHLFFLSALVPGSWAAHLNSPIDFIFGFVVPSGVWLPLAGMFIARGVLTAREVREGGRVDHVIIGFYARIVLMQITIIFGAMLALLLGGVIMLALLIALKTAADIYIVAFGGNIMAAIERANREAARK